MSTENPLKSHEKWIKRGISPTQLDTFSLCQKKWYNDKIRGGRAEDATSSAAQFGTALDISLKHYINGTITKKEELFNLFRTSFLPQHELITKMKDYSIQHGVDIIEKYIETYPIDSSPFRVIDIDIDETLKIPNLQIPLHVIVDYIIEKDGEVWIVDFKSSSLSSENIQRMYKLSFQMTSYMEAMQRKLGVPIAGYIIDYIGTKKKVDRSSFARFEYRVNESQHNFRFGEFMKVANEMANKVNNHHNDPKMFPSNMGSSCTAYFTECPYMSMCEYNDNEKFSPIQINFT